MLKTMAEVIHQLTYALPEVQYGHHVSPDLNRDEIIDEFERIRQNRKMPGVFVFFEDKITYMFGNDPVLHPVS